MIRPFVVAALALSASLFAQAQITPAQGSAWRTGPKTDPADLSTSAGDNGTLTFNGASTPARLYVTCSGAIPAIGRMVVLKIVYRQPPGAPAITQSIKDTEVVEGAAADQPESHSDIRAVQGIKATGAFLTLTLQTLPDPVNAMLEATASTKETFVETFTTGAGQAQFRFPIPPSDVTLQGVLNACGFQPRKGDITPEFQTKMLPIMQGFLALKLHGPVSPTDAAALNKMQDDAKNQNELAIVNQMTGTVIPFIQTEKRPADRLLRNRCVQSLIDVVKSPAAKVSAACGKLEPDME